MRRPHFTSDDSILAVRLRGDRVERNPFNAKRFSGLTEETVHAFDHAGIGSPIGIEGKAALASVVLCEQVRVDVRATKPVDGLLGIANQKKRRCFIIVLALVRLDVPDATKDPVLQLVGVLKFVDQGRAELMTQPTDQEFGARLFKSVRNLSKQIVVGLLASTFFAKGALLLDGRDQVAFEMNSSRLQRCDKRAISARESVALCIEGMLGCGLLLVGLFNELRRGKSFKDGRPVEQCGRQTR